MLKLGRAQGVAMAASLVREVPVTEYMPKKIKKAITGKGAASKEIPLMVENYDIDLIVMGTVGRVGIPGLIIGNTAESILEQTKCSVLAIKPEGFKTPIE